MSVHRLTKEQARRIAVRAQLLDAQRPTDLLEVVSHLTFLQIDPTAAIAPSADLVAWTRMGDAYRPEHLARALDERKLYELRAFVRPMADLGRSSVPRLACINTTAPFCTGRFPLAQRLIGSGRGPTSQRTLVSAPTPGRFRRPSPVPRVAAQRTLALVGRL